MLHSKFDRKVTEDRINPRLRLGLTYHNEIEFKGSRQDRATTNFKRVTRHAATAGNTDAPQSFRGRTVLQG